MLLFAYIFIVFFLFFASSAAGILILEKIENIFIVLILETLVASTFFFALLKIRAQIAAIL